MTSFPTQTVDRDLDRERARTIDAAGPEHAAALRALADERAGDRGVDALASRDFITETLEELADARNYLLWQMQQLDHLEPEKSIDAEHRDALLNRALAHVAEAFALVEAAGPDCARARWPHRLRPDQAVLETEQQAAARVRARVERPEGAPLFVGTVVRKLAERLDRGECA